jgi:hypothetical protein
VRWRIVAWAAERLRACERWWHLHQAPSPGPGSTFAHAFSERPSGALRKVLARARSAAKGAGTCTGWHVHRLRGALRKVVARAQAGTDLREVAGVRWRIVAWAAERLRACERWWHLHQGPAARSPTRLASGPQERCERCWHVHSAAKGAGTCTGLRGTCTGLHVHRLGGADVHRLAARAHRPPAQRCHSGARPRVWGYRSSGRQRGRENRLKLLGSTSFRT